MASRRERLTKGGENVGKFDRTNSFSPSVSKKGYYVQRKSFSFVERGAARRKIEDDHGSDDDDDDDDEEEEKMDMLWEDYFDEEMKRSKVQTISSNNHHHNLGPRVKNKVECKCVQALKLSKASKMPGIVVFINLLKKVFLIHDSNNHPSFKNHSY